MKPETIQEIAKAAAIEALRVQKNEERLRIRKTRYHNTELLLKNYISLLEHYENSKDTASDIMELDDIGVDEIIIYAIKRSRVRTAVMIHQIQTCMEILRVRMQAKGMPEKYEVLFGLYIDQARSGLEWGCKIDTLAQELHCSDDSIRRWRKEMVNELSILLFGVDGLRLEI